MEDVAATDTLLIRPFLTTKDGGYTTLKKVYFDNIRHIDAGGSAKSQERLDEKVKGSKEGRYGVFKAVLLSYLPGKRLDHLSMLPSTFLFDIGKFLGTVTHTLTAMATVPDTFKCQSMQYKWNLDNCLQARAYLEDVPLSRRSLAEEILDKFENCVVPRRSALRSGVIHGDASATNLILSHPENPTQHNLGIIDFGDAVFSHLIYDISISIGSIMMCKSHVDSITAGGHLLAGYQSILPLEDAEKQVLYVCVLSRMAQIQILSYHYIKTRPKNAHIEEGLQESWDLMDALWKAGQDHIDEIWIKIGQSY